MVETTAVVCPHVFADERPIKIVVRHADGGWQLVCGEYDHLEDCSNFEVVGLEHLFERNPSLTEIADLEPGRIAERENKGWTRSHHDD